MKWLLWKDYRHNRLIVIFGLFFLLLPYAMALYAVCLDITHVSKDPQREPFETFAMAGFWSLITSQLTVALVAGNAIAGERVDRSAEFLASLPISRRKLLASKLLFVLAVTAVLWATTSLILWGLAGMAPAAVSHVLGTSTFVSFAVSGVAIFGTAWFLSSVTPSPTIAVCGGLMAPLAVWCGIVFVNFSILDRNYASESLLRFWYAGICLALGVAGFIAGTWYYLRRVEP